MKYIWPWVMALGVTALAACSFMLDFDDQCSNDDECHRYYGRSLSCIEGLCLSASVLDGAALSMEGAALSMEGALPKGDAPLLVAFYQNWSAGKPLSEWVKLDFSSQDEALAFFTRRGQSIAAGREVNGESTVAGGLQFYLSDALYESMNWKEAEFSCFEVNSMSAIMALEDEVPEQEPNWSP